MLETLAHVNATYPRRVLAAWILLLAGCFPLASRLATVTTTDVGSPPGGAAVAVARLVDRAFAGGEGSRIALVAEATGAGPANEDLALRFERVVEALDAVPGVDRLRLPAAAGAELGFTAAAPGGTAAPGKAGAPGSPATGDAGASAGAGVALLQLQAVDRRSVRALIASLRARLPTTGPLRYYLTGGPALDLELQHISEQDALRAELIGLPLSMLVLVVAIGSLVAALIPLLAAMASIVASFAVLYLIGLLVPVASFGQIVVTMLGLATGIDYSLLLVNRFREELARGTPAREAVVATTRTAGRAAMFSGLTVLVALSALLVPPLTFVRTMGAASMIAMLFSVGVSLTAVPALLALLGPRVDALRVSRRAPGTRSRRFWRAWAERLLRHPVRWTIAGATVLLAIAAPALTMQLGFAGVNGVTGATDAHRAGDVLARLGLAGVLRSYDVVIDFGERGFFHPTSLRAMAKLTREAAALEPVARVVSPLTTGGIPPLLVYQYYASRSAAEAGPLAPLLRATVSRDGRYALLRAFPGRSPAPAERDALHRELVAVAAASGLRATVGGAFVADEEWTRALYGSFPLAVTLVYLATFGLLGLAFRSLLIPLKSIVLNTLTVGVAFGTITAVFQHGLGASLFGRAGGLGFVETAVPIFIFAIVFGLSMDYEVFLLARVHEGHRSGRTDRDAVVDALAATGGVITSAALIMIVVFAVFLSSRVVLIQTLSVGLAVAVLLDATLVRMVLVPSLLALFGRWNWSLPRGLARLVDRLGWPPR